MTEPGIKTIGGKSRRLAKDPKDPKAPDVTDKSADNGVSDRQLDEFRKSEYNKHNSEGKVICGYCGFTGDHLEEHLEEAHDSSIAEYMADFPDRPIESTGTGLAKKLSYKKRASKEFSVKDLFGFFWNDKKKKDRFVSGFAEPGPLTPAIDTDFVFDPEATTVALLSLHLGNKLLVYGPTGSGKTALITQIAARLNYNLMRVNLDDDIERTDLIGRFIITPDKAMEFLYGILPRAMVLPGTILLLDEWDSISAETSFVLQRVLEENSQLLILEKGEEIINLHPSNMICATANTVGQGDDSGLYQGTKMQNYAQINRFQLTIELDYLPPDKEIQILLNRFGPDSDLIKDTGLEPLEHFECEAMVQVVNAVRQAFEQGTVGAPLSTRDLCNWGEKFVIWGSANKSAKYCFCNRMPKEDRAVVEEILQRAFGSA